MKQERTISAYKNYFTDFISSLKKEEARKIYYIPVSYTHLDVYKRQIRTGIQALSEACYIMEIRTSPLPSPWNVSTDGAYIPDIYATVCIGEPHAIWGSLFLCRRHDDSILISCCKNSCLPCNSSKAALPGWLSGKKSSSLRSGIFFRQALPGCGQTDTRDNQQ